MVLTIFNHVKDVVHTFANSYYGIAIKVCLILKILIKMCYFFDGTEDN